MKEKTILFLVLANLFWAGNYVYGRYVVAEISPVQLTFVRWAIALCFLLPMAHFLERPDWGRVLRSWKVLGAMSLLGVLGYNLLLYAALQYTSPLNASLVNALNPGVIVVFSVLLLKEKLGKRHILGFAISLLGVLLILTKGRLLQLFEIEYNAGDLLMIAAILVWTFYSIIGRTIKEIPPISATAVSVCMAVVVVFPFAWFHWTPLGGIGSAAKLGILYMGIFPTVGSFLLWNMAVRNIGPSRSGIYLNLITVFTAVISVILGETITLIQLIGGVSVFIGVYLTSRPGQQKKPVPEQKQAKSQTT